MHSLDDDIGKHGLVYNAIERVLWTLAPPDLLRVSNPLHASHPSGGGDQNGPGDRGGKHGVLRQMGTAGGER